MNINIFKKLSDIDRCFAKGRYMNSSELAVICKVSERTIQRYIDIMKSEYKAPIEYDFIRKGFHYTKPFKLKELDLSASELYDLAVIFELVKGYDHNPYKSGQKFLLNKIRTAYGDEINDQITEVKEKISFRFSPVKKYDEKIFKIIENALFNERTIEINYIKTDPDNGVKRTIDPYHLRNFNGDWYLIGYEHNRKRVRVTAVNRIASVKLINRYFDIPADFDVKEYFKFSFGKRRSSKPIKTELEIKKEFVNIYKEREIHSSQKFKTLRNGNLKVTLIINELTEIKDWLKKEGTRIRVISPPELIQMIRKDAEDILKQYS